MSVEAQDLNLLANDNRGQNELENGSGLVGWDEVTQGVVLTSFEGDTMGNFSKSCGIAMNEVKVEPVPELIEKLIIYATDIKKNGVMSVEGKIQEEPNPFFKQIANRPKFCTKKLKN